jgi:hypothetical protein
MRRIQLASVGRHTAWANVSAVGRVLLSRAMASAASELLNMSRANDSCPAIFSEMSSLEILSAAPFVSARACALRRWSPKRRSGRLRLSHYLLPKIDPDPRSSVEDCPRQMPLGAWRKAWQECDYGPEFIETNPIAKQGTSGQVVANSQSIS